MITIEDSEEFHVNDGHAYWNESAWFSFQAPERELNGWVYYWHRPNMQASFGGVCLWDQTSEHPMDCVYFDWDLHPLPAAMRMHDFSWENGLSSQCVRPLEAYRFSYQNDYCQMALDWIAVMAPHESVFDQKSYGDFGHGHYDQCGRMSGNITLPSETIQIDCLSLRDRSWGPRQHNNNPRVNYSWAIASEKSSFCVGAMAVHSPQSDPVTGTTERVTFGHFMRDGIVGNVNSGERRGRCQPHMDSQFKDNIYFT